MRARALAAAAAAVLAAVPAAAGAPEDSGMSIRALAQPHAYAVTTVDDGSCGAGWAVDTFVRTFVVSKNADGSTTLAKVEHGRFVVRGGDGKSPGACERAGVHGSRVRAGVHGTFVGVVRGVVHGDWQPDAPCRLTECGETQYFLETYFGPQADFACFDDSADCSSSYTYTAAKGQGLRLRVFRERTTGAGTLEHVSFSGDIANA